MNKLFKSISRTLLLLSIVAISFSSCTQINNKDLKNLSYGTCEGCHTDLDHLKLVYTADTAAPAGGCGGTAPHYEPYERVYMAGSGYEAYKGTVHDMACTKCHNGVDNTSDKVKAHSGDFLKHPSSEYVNKCGKCHSDITDNFATNLHNGIGQMDKVAKRSGLTGHAQFADLPQHQQDGYTAKCATCHGTCGNCHVVRPTLAGGGLTRGHQFIEKPDMVSVCVSCHSSRGGHAYLGQGVSMDPDIVPDVHLTEAGFNNCTYCHSEVEIHGTGEAVDHRYDYSALPTCTAAECHPDVNGSAGDNGYHKTHLETFNCQVCHSQDYNSCGECHVNGDDARIPHYLDFKIALNPLVDPDDNHDYPLALVRRTLGAPDNWERYTGENYDNFNAFPMFNYTTPHNIIKNTTRTIEGVDTYPGCTLNCHIWDDNGTLKNKGLYLLNEDFDPLKPWQESSTGHITLDDRSPISGWISK